MSRRTTLNLFFAFAVTFVALFGARSAWAQESSCSGNPDPSASSVITFAPAHAPEDTVLVTNNSGSSETFTIVVDQFYTSGTHIHHFQSAPMVYPSHQQRSFNFSEDFPANNNYYNQVQVFDTNGCRRFNAKLNQNITVSGQTHYCVSNCTIHQD